MTQVKNSKKPIQKAFNMQQEWLKLAPVEQEKVTAFFNAHNLAHLLYSLCEKESQSYISQCIRMNNTANQDEKKEV